MAEASRSWGSWVEAADPVLGTARWLPGSMPGEALAVHVHRPRAGSVRGAVVLAPPVGREQVASFRSLRVLAMRAASRAGAVVLRPSWSGLGESTGRLPSDPARAWREDLLRLIAAAREAAPGAEVSVIGLRLGAAVAAGVVDEPSGAQRTVLWEPVGGRRFVHEQRALRRMSVEQPVSPGEIELPGLSLSPAQSDSLASLALPSDDELTRRGGIAVVRAAQQDRVEAERMYAVASRDARVSLSMIDRVIALAMPDGGGPTGDPAEGDARPPSTGPAAESPEAGWATHWDSPPAEGLVAVRSEFVTIGADRLPGVLASPVPDQPVSEQPTTRRSVPRQPRSASTDRVERAGQAAGLLLIAADAEPMDGPTGLWARTARELAGQGLVVLRAERRGVGEAGEPDALGEPMPYTEEAAADTREALRWLRTRAEGPVAACGLCSGAWLALKCAAQLDLVILLNCIAWTPRGEYFRRFYRDGAVQRLLGGRERLSREPDGRRARLKTRLKALRFEVLRAMPLWMLRAAARTGQVQALEQMFRGDPAMPPVDLHLGDSDRESFVMAGGQRAVRALQRRGLRVRAMPLGEADHALLAVSSRRRAVAALRFSLGLPSPEPGAGAG